MLLDRDKYAMEELLEMTRACELLYLLYEHMGEGTEINRQSFLNTLDTMKINYTIVYKLPSSLKVDIYLSRRYGNDKKYEVVIRDNKVTYIEQCKK